MSRESVLSTAADPSSWPAGTQVIFLGMGCFWGAEEAFWDAPGVVATAVGYQGGTTPNPSYQLVCTGTTGHAENVMIAYDPAQADLFDLLRIFWENHDPTQGMRQGNDVGSQYRSTAYWTTTDQQKLIQETRDAYEKVLTARGIGPITTELAPAIEDGVFLRPFYFAEEYHQKYLWKNPHGYRCHANTGIALPELAR